MIINTLTATILSGASLSDGVDLGSDTLMGVIMPAAWTAADITFQGSVDGVNYHDLYYESEEVASVAAVDRLLTFAEDKLAGFRFVKVRSGVSATPVLQEADRVITLIKY